jgi:arylsulfatase A-like enzyme
MLRSSASGANWNVVLVVNDTMRRDRPGAYGGSARTPHLDALAREGLLFEQAVTQAPWTKPSIATLFTSLYPTQHHVVTHPKGQERANQELSRHPVETDVLSPSLTTLAEVMQAGGWHTAAFIANPWLDRRFGFAQGFEVYEDSFAAFGTPGTAVSRAALAWLGSVPDGERFFLYVHYMDSHWPYPALSRAEVVARAAELRADTRPLPAVMHKAMLANVRFADGTALDPEQTPPSVKLLELAYDRGVENFDEALGELLAGLAPRGGPTALFVTSDHGEAFFERGWGSHGRSLYGEEVAIPLVARLPGVTAPGGRVDCPVGLVDVLPTLCTLVGLPCPAEAQGVSFVQRDGAPSAGRRYLVSEAVIEKPEHRALQNGRVKLIYAPEGTPTNRPSPAHSYELYDLDADPDELHDLLAPAAPDAPVLGARNILAGALKSAVPPLALPAAPRAPLGPEQEERLRALGYLE